MKNNNYQYDCHKMHTRKDSETYIVNGSMDEKVPNDYEVLRIRAARRRDTYTYHVIS